MNTASTWFPRSPESTLTELGWSTTEAHRHVRDSDLAAAGWDERAGRNDRPRVGSRGRRGWRYL